LEVKSIIEHRLKIRNTKAKVINKNDEIPADEKPITDAWVGQLKYRKLMYNIKFISKNK